MHNPLSGPSPHALLVDFEDLLQHTVVSELGCCLMFSWLCRRRTALPLQHLHFSYRSTVASLIAHSETLCRTMMFEHLTIRSQLSAASQALLKLVGECCAVEGRPMEPEEERKCTNT